jgi:F-type H+-transporting ATPase subunit b
MDSILQALGSLALRALPTLLLVALLNLYLKLVFFKPLQRVLDARYDATEGARRAAEESLGRVEARTAEYEEALRAARAEIYQNQEHMYARLEEERAARLQAAHADNERAVAAAKAALEAEVLAAKVGLAAQSEALAEQIAGSVLEARVA